MTNGPKRSPSAFPDTYDPATGDLNVVVETPQGSRNKYTYDGELGMFRLGSLLPLGTVFPFDFGFLPGTLGGDGDPVDVLLLMDEAAFPGCLVPARLVGVIEAEQVEQGRTERNDRLIAVASASRTHGSVRSLDDLNASLLKEIESFFMYYNGLKGKEFRILGMYGPERAQLTVEEAIEQYSTV
ncbi:inorganic diphosphatase [Geobacter sp. SVR]|uniref:inorganic diphosphatase n=1 Tax=Geobacter sp. SVR TaxID=2495594 RepID=UPI00143EF552|nr:inorganic diphosphatase [Geobacter sp. SVR]BCS52539.1 inorganic pyrophosphatase [Geobacter sp. SVR]GCF84024.1 inorganic pyrophosphatase [Geobacter sp. SVR]